METSFRLGETVICGLPDMDMAADKWREDILPAIERSRYRDLLPVTDATPVVTLGEGSTPLVRLDRLSERQFRVMRSFMFPSSDQTLAGARASAIIVQAGLERMAAERGLRLVSLQPEWYGWDPIHFRHRYWRRAWGEFLGLDPDAWNAAPEPGGFTESVRLWLRADEHRWLCGIHQFTPQHGKLQLY